MRVFIDAMQEKIAVALPNNVFTITLSAENSARFAGKLVNSDYVFLSLAEYNSTNSSWGTVEHVRAVSIAGNVLTLERDNPVAFDAGYFVCAGVEADVLATMKGDTGDTGLSTYEQAVLDGFVGTESEWLLSLKGDKGDKGDTGDTGLSNYQIAVSEGFVGTESEWLLSIKGDKGDKGDIGEQGISPYEQAVLNGFVGTEAAWLESLKAVQDSRIIVQNAHGFSVLSPIYWNGTVWAKARSNNVATLGTHIVVSVTDSNTFILQSNGYVTGLSGLIAGEFYVVSDATAGLLTITAPTAPTSFVNCLLQALTATTAEVKQHTCYTVGLAESSIPELVGNKNESDGYVGLSGFKTVLKNAAGTVTSYLESIATTSKTWQLPDISGVLESIENKNVSGGYVGLSLFKAILKNATGTISSTLESTATAARNWFFPDYSGQIIINQDSYDDLFPVFVEDSVNGAGWTMTAPNPAEQRMVRTAGSSNTRRKLLFGYHPFHNTLLNQTDILYHLHFEVANKNAGNVFLEVYMSAAKRDGTMRSAEYFIPVTITPSAPDIYVYVPKLYEFTVPQQLWSYFDIDASWTVTIVRDRLLNTVDTYPSPFYLHTADFHFKKDNLVTPLSAPVLGVWQKV